MGATMVAEVVAVLLLMGCSAPQSASPEATQAIPSADTSTATATAPAKKLQAFPFGQPQAFPDGLQVTVTPSVYVNKGTGTSEAVGPIVVLAIRVENVGQSTVNADRVGNWLDVRYGPDGAAAEYTIHADPEAGIGNQSFGSLVPGQVKSGRMGFIIPKAYWNDVVVTVPPADYTDQPLVFAGAVN